MIRDAVRDRKCLPLKLVSLAGVVLPEREGQLLLDNIEHAVKGSVLGTQEPGCAQQEEIAGGVDPGHAPATRA